MRHFTVLFMCFASLFACQSLPPPDGPKPAYQEIHTGAQLKVNQPLTIPASRVSIFFQRGKQVEQKQLNLYHPNCKIELFTMRDTARIINSGLFEISRVATLIDTVSLGGIRFAALNLFADADASPSSVNYVTEFFLQSKEQPDVYRLSCAHWEDPYDARHLSVSEIKNALGDIISFTGQ